MKKIFSIIFFGILFFNAVNSAYAYQQISLVQHNFNQANTSSSDKFNYVIITTSDLENIVISLKTWKEYPGFSVEIVNISWISSSYDGKDIQEQIRNFLIDKYEEWGIDYVLIVGTRNTIPMRRCHPLPNVYDDSVFSDYYYSDLTGNWDLDEDGYYGEYEDDDVDFIPEISIGRIPSDNNETVKRICQNIIEFGSDTGTWKKNALLLGSIIYYQNLEAYEWIYDRSDGATVMEECRDDIFEPNGFTCVRMYETEGIRPSTYPYEYPLDRSTVLSEWKNDYGIVNMLGHANERYITRFIWDHDDGDNIPEISEGELVYEDFLRSTDSKDLSLEKPPIVFSAGCSQLHSSRNMGKSFMENNAAVAFIGTTDLGFYNITRVWNDENDGGAFSIDYFFFYYLISQNQKCGDALSNSKIYFYNNFMFTEYEPDWIYRCYSTLYGFTLYGDPSLGFYPISNPPEKPNTPDGPASGKIKTEYAYFTSSIEPDSDQIRYLFDWGDNTTTITDYYPSGDSIVVSHEWNEHGTFNIKVRAEDDHGAWSEWSDPLSVSMPKSKPYINTPFLNFLENFLQNHPLIYQLLQRVLNL